MLRRDPTRVWPAPQSNEDEGSAARLINDETLARAIEDVVIGVNDSKFLRSLIHNRKKKGEAVREKTTVEPGDATAPVAPPAPEARPEG